MTRIWFTQLYTNYRSPHGQDLLFALAAESNGLHFLHWWSPGLLSLWQHLSGAVPCQISGVAIVLTCRSPGVVETSVNHKVWSTSNIFQLLPDLKRCFSVERYLWLIHVDCIQVFEPEKPPTLTHSMALEVSVYVRAEAGLGCQRQWSPGNANRHRQGMGWIWAHWETKNHQTSSLRLRHPQMIFSCACTHVRGLR